MRPAQAGKSFFRSEIGVRTSLPSIRCKRCNRVRQKFFSDLNVTSYSALASGVKLKPLPHTA
ncbi:hypothetical protein D3C80_1655790 [compost metagenome]